MKRHMQLIFVLLGCTALTTVFAFHTIHGRHGLEARSQLTERSGELAREISSLEAVRDEYERQINLLGQTPHQDMIEEIAQRDLGFSYPDEILIAR